MPLLRRLAFTSTFLLAAPLITAFVGCSAASNGVGGTTSGAGGTGGTSATTSTTGVTTSTTTTGAGGDVTTVTTSTTATTGGAGGSGGSGGDPGAGGAGGDIGSGSGGAGGGIPIPTAEVYAHSPSTLYKLDPISQVVTTIGDFNGCLGSVIDIALDKNGLIFATTFNGLYTINKANAVCTQIAIGNYPNSLSFVPAGTVDPNKEALVGYVGSTYVRIDTGSGAISNIGSLGIGYSSSGDVVSLINGGSYLTVVGDKCNDCIVEVDPKTGALLTIIGPLGHSSVYGLAYWAGVAYGFDNAGELFSIDVSTGMSTVIPIPNAPPGLQFWGAGSSTAAPHQ